MNAEDPRAWFIAEAEATVRRLEARKGEEWAAKLLPEARRALRRLKHPEKVKPRVPKSNEVLKHQAQQLRMQVLEFYASNDE